MKKLLGILLSIIILSFNLCFFTACGGSDEVEPEYSNIYTYNDSMHWRNQLNGNGRTDVGEHVDNGTGTCSVCEYVIYQAVYANTWSFDSEYHWKAQTNGLGVKDKAKHVNNSGKCRTCAYYYDATEFLEFEKYKIGDIEGYMVTEILDEEFEEDKIFRHIEVPTHYQGEGDEAPLPVIAVGDGALSTGNINGKVYNTFRISSVKLNEGLLELRQWAFNNSNITELIIPNSVTNEQFHTWNSDVTGIIYNLCGGCQVKRFVIGDGIKVLGSYNFNKGYIKEVVLGNGLKRINPRAFYEIYSLEYLVIPASVNQIPEGTIEGSGNAAKAPHIKMFPDTATTKIFMEITKEEHDALLVEQRRRDLQGNILNPLPANSIGFVKGWSGNCPIYFKGEWHYDKNGKPIPN